MSKVRAIVLAGNGINCERETAYACKLGGADEVDIVYLWDLAAGEASLDGYQFLCCPGGFLDGDDLGSAKASTIRLRHTEINGHSLVEQIQGHVEKGGLVMGICNGFQLMIKLGLLPALDNQLGVPQATLTWNNSSRFEDRWVTLKADPASTCIFTKGIDTLELPVRHGEGQIVAPEETMIAVRERHQGPLAYINPETGEATETYPLNPNGTRFGIAALSDTTGRLFGMMPHPEAFLHRTNHPRWTRENLPEEGAGLQIFKNAVNYIRENM
ncbi:MAG: phosphoribosylformylglycinamidine synthase subunit PurQ [Deltaproteobacteria bacterium]|nr:phosphoribosylformylglycinamidine synthase subunit PurQ [Deltaproteobacteria bacterium]MBN2670308.1 phosphoribosylformylglycinamidine synthase subunit PurQ [Deltaproteobacteria bacterium]